MPTQDPKRDPNKPQEPHDKDQKSGEQKTGTASKPQQQQGGKEGGRK